jgi:hypothetical protein
MSCLGSEEPRTPTCRPWSLVSSSLLLSFASGCYLGADTRETHALDAGDGDIDSSLSPAAATDSDPAAHDGGGTQGIDAGCTSDLACPASAPVCTAGRCGACSQQAQCGRFPASPACGGAGACVACVSDNKALCTASTAACDPASNQCVQCVSNPDCLSEQNAACKADHTCGLCSADSDCSRFGKVCDTRVGACVQCRPETEEADCRGDQACNPATADCAGTACDPKLFTCTNKQRASVSTCQACVSDSECVSSHRCIKLGFGSAGDAGVAQDLGGFCLKKSSSGCMVPYATPLTAASLSGAAAEKYCGINEASTTCAAIKALDDAKTCPTGSDASCGALGSRCESVNSIANVCTYSCSGGLECPSGVACGGPEGDKYCGG